MDTSSFIGKTLERVFAFPSGPVHPAWVNELTTPIVTWAAYLDLGSVDVVHVDACEIVVDAEKYPSLGLSFAPVSRNVLRRTYQDGGVAVAEELREAAELLPARICAVVESDPLGGGCVSECILQLEGGGHILFRHIFPPETLGIAVEKHGRAPNNSSKPTPLRGAA